MEQKARSRRDRKWTVALLTIAREGCRRTDWRNLRMGGTGKDSWSNISILWPLLVLLPGHTGSPSQLLISQNSISYKLRSLFLGPSMFPWIFFLKNLFAFLFHSSLSHAIHSSFPRCLILEFKKSAKYHKADIFLHVKPT